jgi:hypothetical protein
MAGRPLIDRRQVIVVVAQGAGILLAGLLVLAAAVLITILLVPPRFALSTAFFWGSLSLFLLTHLGMGVVAGRRSPRRLRSAGVQPGWPRVLTAISGPAGMALLIGLAEAGKGTLMLGTVSPVCAAAAGAAIGFRLAARRSDF